MRLFYLIILTLSISISASAQDSRVVEERTNNAQKVYSAEEIQAIRTALDNHPYTKYYDRLIEEYKERMEANVKKYKKMSREMQKPQYSDPMYFGHKRKPKKRAVGKRKYCKECEIVH
jgi:hypothetical protein